MVLAGVVLSAAIACAGRWKRPARADWLHALWLGLFMVLMASGFLAKGQESITSGVAAVVTGSTPISMLVAAWLFGGERRPSAMQWLGLAGGLCGLILLGKSHGVGVGPDHSSMGGILWVFGATGLGGGLAADATLSSGHSARSSAVLRPIAVRRRP